MPVIRAHIRQLFMAAQVLLFAAAIAVATLTSSSADWRSVPLLGLLLILSVLGEWMTVTVGSQNLSSGFIALILAATLLGPAPAVAMGIVAVVVDLAHRKPPPAAWATNLSTYATYLLVGGLLSRAVIGDAQAPDNIHLIRGPEFALVVFGVFVVANVLNFALVAVAQRVLLGRRMISHVRSALVPMLPGQFAAAIIAAILALAYTNFGYLVLVGLVVVILIFQYLTVALLRSEDRAEQLRARTVNLASLQIGVLATLVETLALRDRAAARHAASVARYARALTREMGCDEATQDLAHTASLLHDIGKFALPDRVLHADVLSDRDWALIRRHPQDGATLVGRLDGYGPVAEIILYHHEQVDGTGYPAGLIGNEIPLLSRVIAVCDTYDTLTARDGYQSAMTPQDALAELRRVASRHLDADIVQTFTSLVEREGPATFTDGETASFETELAFERRSRALAAPSLVDG